MNNDGTNTQITQQESQIQQFEQQLNKARNQDLANLYTRINSQNPTPEIKNSQELKSRLLIEAQTSQSKLKSQAEATKQKYKFGLAQRFCKMVFRSVDCWRFIYSDLAS